MIIFLYGEDAFRSMRKVAEIKNKFLLSDKSGSGLSVFDCEQEKEAAGKIKTVLSTANLLAPKRLVIVKNAMLDLASEQQKEILVFLQKKARELEEDKDVVAVFWEKNEPKKSNALFKFLFSSSAKKQNFEKMSGKKLEAWTFKMMGEIDPRAKVSRAALEKLIAYCASDTQLLFSQMQKLISYAGEKMIEEKDVDLLVRANLDANIFQMVDALGVGNKKEALRLLHNHTEKGDDPFYLLSMFFYQFRNMLKVADLFERGIRSEYEISRLTKLHPFVVKKSLAQIVRLPLEKLKIIYTKLVELDTAVKTGQIEIGLGLDKFVAEL